MFGKQQFVGKVEGTVTDQYQMIKVQQNFIFRKLDQGAMEEFTE